MDELGDGFAYLTDQACRQKSIAASPLWRQVEPHLQEIWEEYRHIPDMTGERLREQTELIILTIERKVQQALNSIGLSHSKYYTNQTIIEAIANFIASGVSPFGSDADTLLVELRKLARAQPGDAAVRKQLAMCLFNTLNAAKTEGNLARRDALLVELRKLARVHPDDAAAREQLAMSLLNTLNYAKAEGDLARRDALLAELRNLARAYPDDIAVHEQLDMGLFNTLASANEENLSSWKALELLDEWRGNRGWRYWLRRRLLWLVFLLRGS